MSAPRLPGEVAGHLALPRWRGDADRKARSRRTALGLALLVLMAGLAVLVATGKVGVPGSGFGGKPSAVAAVMAEADSARAAPRRAAPAASDARPRSDRVVPPNHAAALFAQHTWFVLPPAPLPPPPPPPPPPTAPPFPYTFLGSYAPDGAPPVFFLSRGDRVVDAHVGDRLDGVYQFESAAGGQLVFVYLPLNIRQSPAAGASK